MNEEKNKVVLFVDDEKTAFAELNTPVHFEFDTSKLTDGEHILKIVSKSQNGKEGIRKIKFIVRNGPAIDIDGLRDNEVVDGVLPLMINAYDKGDLKKFAIGGSETPQSVPTWIWILMIVFVAWALYFGITSLNNIP